MKRRPDEYVLFKFKLEYAEFNEENAWLFEMLDELSKNESLVADGCPEYEIEIMRISHDVYDKRGEFCEDYVAYAGDYEDSDVKGRFASLGEAELKLTIAGWKMEDVTSKYKKPEGNEYLGRSVVKAYKLSRLCKGI